jgi:hypothetical protein
MGACATLAEFRPIFLYGKFNREMLRIGNWKSSQCYWKWAWFAACQCVMHFDDRRSYWSFFFRRDCGDWWKSLIILKNTALCHVSVGRVFQFNGTLHHSSRRFSAFLDREFPDHWLGRGFSTSWPLRSSDFTLLYFFFWGYVKWIIYHEKCRMWMGCVVGSLKLQRALPMKYLPLPGDKLGIVLVCVVPLMVPYWDLLST